MKNHQAPPWRPALRHPARAMPRLWIMLAILAWPVAKMPGAPASAPETPPEKALRIFVAYPEPGSTVAFDHVMLEGSVTPGASLSVSGRAIPVGADGLFIEWLPLQPGENALELVARRGPQALRQVLSVTSKAARPLPATPTRIVAGSVSPSADVKFFDLNAPAVSRVITIAFDGSPGGAASFKVGGRGPFPMPEQKPEEFPGSRSVAPGHYEGSFVLQPGDNLGDAAVIVSLKGADGQSVAAEAAGHVTARAQNQPRVGIVTRETLGNGANATSNSARNGPGRNSILFLRPGMKMLVVGEAASTYTVAIAPSQSLSVLKDQLRLLPEGTPLPRRYFSRIESRRVPGATQIRFFLPDRVPCSIIQTASAGDQHLDVRLYNTESDVDYMVSDFPDGLVRGLRWTQEADGVFATRIDLGGRQQWGYQTFYEGNTLVLQVKDAPQIRARRPLEGHKILIDAGHGGSESGAMGGFGVPEKQITLDISLRLAALLRARGAQVILSRQSDARVPLADRPLLAEKSGAEILLSIHANALPDGVDPGTQRGTAAYYYQPQARALADSLLAALLRGVPEAGNDGLHYQNLALTRPTSQLSVLIETAFLTDKGNLRLLMSPAGRDKFAEALARGLEEFYKLNATR